jgi:hypothetical protein
MKAKTGLRIATYFPLEVLARLIDFFSHPGLCHTEVSRCGIFTAVLLFFNRYYVRAPTLAEVEATIPRITACFE